MNSYAPLCRQQLFPAMAAALPRTKAIERECARSCEQLNGSSRGLGAHMHYCTALTAHEPVCVIRLLKMLRCTYVTNYANVALSSTRLLIATSCTAKKSADSERFNTKHCPTKIRKRQEELLFTPWNYSTDFLQNRNSHPTVPQQK
jgi:hypothetical protein